jgi:hypothetical protein
VAAYGCGLAKFDGVNWTVYPVPETYDPGGFSAMLVDSYNRVWLSSYWFYVDYPRENYNLYCFEDGFWTLYNEINSSLHGGGVSCMAQDSAGNILLGTVFSGLLMFSGGSWQDYLNINNGLYSNDIHDISFDADGNMWLATALGIAKVSGDIVTTYKEGNSGLTSNYVYAITTDSYNNKWIGTGRGLNVFNENGIVHNPDIPVAQLSPLMSVYPNPFTRVANIRLNFTKSSRYSLSVYNVKGQLVKKLADGAYAKAEDSVTWDGTSDNGSPVSRGIYFLRLQGDGFSQARKVIFLR